MNERAIFEVKKGRIESRAMCVGRAGRGMGAAWPAGKGEKCESSKIAQGLVWLTESFKCVVHRAVTLSAAATTWARRAGVGMCIAMSFQAARKPCF